MPAHPTAVLRPAVSPRSAIIVLFASFGAAVGALSGSMPVLMRNAAIDAATIGFGLTLSTFMTVGAMVLGGQLARYMTNRAALLIVLPVFALLILAYLTAQSPAWFYLAIIPMGFCFGLTDLFMNAEATAIEHDMGRPVFTAFHGAVSLGVAGMAILASFISTMIGTWAIGLIAAAGFGLAWIFVYTSIAPRRVLGGRSGRIAILPNKLPLALLGIAAGLIIGGETAALLWSAKLLDGLAPSLAAIAGLGAAFYGLCNAAIRFPGDALRARFGDLPLMIGSLFVAIAGFAGLGMTESFAASVAAFAMVGLGTAVLVPCIFSMAAGLVPDHRAGALGFMALLTSVPRILAPWFFGLLVTGFGIGAAFGLVAIALAAALVLLVLLNKMMGQGQ